MNRENQTPAAGRLIGGCLVGILLAMIAPLALLTEIVSLTTVLLIPSIGLVWLYRWAGKAPAMFSAALQMFFTALMMDGTFMWMAFFMTIVPVFLLMNISQRPFFEQMKVSLGAFGAGIVIAVAILYLSFGGNMIERTLAQLPQAMRSVPLEAIEVPMANISAALGRELTPEGFYQVFEDAINGLIPSYQLHLPAQIFCGAIISAVFCVWLSNYMLNRRSMSADGSYMPLREWALPASTTGGLLLITIVSYIIYAAGMQHGKTLYFTVYNITATAFCIQAVGSVARRLNHPQVAARSRTGIIVGVILLWLLGGALYIAIYGCISAIFGFRGALTAQRKNNANNHHSDDEYRR